MFITGGSEAILRHLGTDESMGEMVLHSCELYDPGTKRYSFTAPMSVPRILHTAVLLRNGQVLIDGGKDDHGRVLASVEIYVPDTDRFAGTSSGTERL